jgi:Integron cassette protein VCH_CASS1 chain
MTKHDAEVLYEYAIAVMHCNDGSQLGHVKGIALALLGGVIWRSDAGSLKVSPPLVLEFEAGGTGYMLTDNAVTGDIELRHRESAGPSLHSFSNDTPVEYVQAVFRGL